MQIYTGKTSGQNLTQRDSTDEQNNKCFMHDLHVSSIHGPMLLFNVH